MTAYIVNSAQLSAKVGVVDRQTAVAVSLENLSKKAIVASGRSATASMAGGFAGWEAGIEGGSSTW
jgi:hypothetical protein